MRKNEKRITVICDNCTKNISYTFSLENPKIPKEIDRWIHLTFGYDNLVGDVNDFCSSNCLKNFIDQNKHKNGVSEN